MKKIFSNIKLRLILISVLFPVYTYSITKQASSIVKPDSSSFYSHKKEYKQYKVNIAIGLFYNSFFGYNIRNEPPNFSKTNKLYNSGYSFNASAVYWIKPKIGIGISQEYYKKHSEEQDQKYFPIRYYNEKLRLNTYALNFYRKWNIHNNFNHKFILNLGANLTDYFANVNNIIDYGHYKVTRYEDYTKFIWGAELGIAYEKTITKHLNIGIKAQIKYSESSTVYIQPRYKEKEHTRLYDTEKINLSRASVGVYLNFN